MPVYSDLDPEFRTKNSGEILIVTDEDAINASLENIFSISPGERLMNPVWGSELSGMLGEEVSEDMAVFIEMAIQNSFLTEERATLSSVTVTPNYDNNEYEVVVDYTITATGASATFQKTAKWE